MTDVVLLKRIAGVMSDGRWRTGTDVANALQDVNIPTVNAALSKLVRLGIVVGETPVDRAPKTYRAVRRDCATDALKRADK